MAGVQVTIGADSRKAARELKSFEKKTKGIAASIAKGFKERVGHKLLDGLSSAAREIPAMLNEAITTASNLNEEIGKSEVIFGKSSAVIQEFSKNSVESLGLSELAAMTATGTFGNLFKTMGMGEAEVVSMSKEMTALAADLGAFHNTSTEDAIMAIGAALRGESEPVRRYGVLLDDAALKAEALAMGIYDGVGTLKPAIKAQAAYNVILKQTTDAQGNFSATAAGLAGQKKILQANIEDLTTEIGQRFLPIMKDLVTTLNNTNFEGLVDNLDSAISGFQSFGAAAQEAANDYFTLLKMIPGMEKSAAVIGSWFEVRDKNKSGMTEVPDFLKDEEDSLSDEEKETLAIIEDLNKAEAEFVAEKAKALALEKEHDEAAKASLHAERERLELLEEQNKEREKAAATERGNVRREMARDIAGTLEQFGIAGPSRDNMLKDLLGLGFDGAEAEKLVAMESKRSSLFDVNDDLNAASSRSSLSAVSSLQRVGGGGGAYGELDLQRRQTDLQQKMVSLLEDLKTESSTMPLSDF